MQFKTIIGKVKFTSNRKAHIIQTHPIMEAYLSNLKEALERPDEIRYSSYNQNILLFYRFFDNIENGKYITVVVDRVAKRVITTYLTHRIKTGRIYEKD